MEDMIKRILALDHMEQELTEEAEKVRREAEQKVSEMKNELKEDYLARARKRAAENSRKEQEEADREWAAIQKKTEDSIRRLERAYEENSARWVEDLTERVTGTRLS